MAGRVVVRGGRGARPMACGLVIVLALLGLSGGCLTHFAVPYRYRIAGASFSVAPPWLVRSNPSDGSTDLWNVHGGGSIRVRTLLDPNLVVPPVLGDSFLVALWNELSQGLREPKLVEKRVVPGEVYQTASLRFEADGRLFTQAYLFNPPQVAIVTYSGSPSDPIIHIDGFERLIQSFRFESTGASTDPVAPVAIASPVPLPASEYRRGLFIHRSPRFSFQVPDGWRPATPADVASFSYVKRAFMEAHNEEERQRLQGLRQGRIEDLRGSATTLVSPSGATIEVGVEHSHGMQYRAGATLTEGEKQEIWNRLRAGTARAGNLSWLSMDIVNFGPNTVLRIRLFREADIRDMAADTGLSPAKARAAIDREAIGVRTLLALYGETHVVIVAHLGTFENGRDGLADLEALAESFRFE